MMATLKEVDRTAVGGSDKLPTQEDAAGEQSYMTSDRRHVDALLDMSEEDFLKELEPQEYHCYSGWEEAVRGWARVAPLSCILLTQKRYKKLKHKEADNTAPMSADPTIPDADSSASIAEHRCESHASPSNSFKKLMLLNQQTESCSNTAVAHRQKDTSEWSFLNAVQKTSSNLLLGERIEEERALRETHLQNRPAKPEKHSHRLSYTVVPIKNFSFLPPIESPQLNPQRVSGKTAPEEDTVEENGFMFDKKSGMRGTRGDPAELPAYSAGLTSKHQTCQHNPHLVSALSVSVGKRYQVPMSSKCDTANRTSLSMAKRLTQALHSSTAAGAQASMHPSKTVCAVKLYKGCEINV